MRKTKKMEKKKTKTPVKNKSIQKLKKRKTYRKRFLCETLASKPLNKNLRDFVKV